MRTSVRVVVVVLLAIAPRVLAAAPALASHTTIISEGMSRYLPYNPDQAYLLPPSVKGELGVVVRHG